MASNFPKLYLGNNRGSKVWFCHKKAYLNAIDIYCWNLQASVSLWTAGVCLQQVVFSKDGNRSREFLNICTWCCANQAIFEAIKKHGLLLLWCTCSFEHLINAGHEIKSGIDPKSFRNDSRSGTVSSSMREWRIWDYIKCVWPD